MNEVNYDEELYDIYEDLFIDDIVNITNGYFEVDITDSTALATIYEKEESQTKTLKLLKFKLFVTDEDNISNNVQGDPNKNNIETNDDGFVEDFAKVINDYKKDMLEAINERLTVESIDNNSSLNTEDYIFVFKSIKIVPKCEVSYIRRGDLLMLHNVIIVWIYFTEEDISVYRPGGVEARRTESNYEMLSEARRLGINTNRLTDKEIMDRIADNYY